MIYVGIGSLQCSMEHRDLKPIMLHGNQITIANPRIDRVTWRLMTSNSRKIYWIDTPKVYEDEDVEFALKCLNSLRDNMLKEASSLIKK